MRSISPELVLVDPELALLARELLPDPPDCLAPRTAPAPEVVLLEPAPEPPIVEGRATVVEAPAPLAAAAAAPTEALTPLAAAAAAPTEAPTASAAHASVAPVATAPVAPLAPPLRGPALPAPAPVVSERLPVAKKRRRRRHIPIGLAASWLVAGAAVASPFLAFLPPPESEVPVLQPAAPPAQVTPGAAQSATAPRPAPRPARTPKVTPAPARPVQRPSPVVVRWPAADRAMFYDVILVRDGKRLDLWPTRNSLELTGSEAPGAETYDWFAYPAYKAASGVRYGDLLAHGKVTVAAGSVKGERRPPLTEAR